ncbi:MAG: hypothetical protein WAU36_11640 [Cyclobacteriaceae bacterium]
MLTSCGGSGKISYQPPYIPIKIGINTNGEITIQPSTEIGIQTNFGTFELGGNVSYDIPSLRQNETYKDKRLLIVRVDHKATVFELTEGEEFRIEFQDNNTGYNKVRLVYEEDEDIVLELESAQSGALVQASTNVVQLPTATRRPPTATRRSPTATPKPPTPRATSTPIPTRQLSPTSSPTPLATALPLVTLPCSRVNNGHAFDGGLLLGCEGYVYYAFYNDHHIEKVVISEAQARANQKTYCGSDSESPYLEWGLNLAFCKAKSQYGKSLGNAQPYVDNLTITFGNGVVNFNGEFGLQRFIITRDRWDFSQ